MSKCKCQKCGRILTNPESIKRGYGATCFRIIKLSQTNKTEPEQPEKLDINEIKLFITSEIQKALKDFNFSKTINNDNTEDTGIVPIKIKKMPKFNILEVNKRMVVKELKEQLAKGIKNMLQEVGSFDEQIDFLEIPVGISA